MVVTEVTRQLFWLNHDHERRWRFYTSAFLNPLELGFVERNVGVIVSGLQRWCVAQPQPCDTGNVVRVSVTVIVGALGAVAGVLGFGPAAAYKQQEREQGSYSHSRSI